MSQLKKRHPLNKVQLDLLVQSAEELIVELSDRPKISGVREFTFGHFDTARNEEVQVQVTVTRAPLKFIDPMAIETIY